MARAASRRRTHRRDRTQRPTPTSGASGSRPPPRSACSAPRASPRSGPLFDLLPAINRVYPAALVDAYRTGGGIPYADYALHDAQGDFNRPAYVNLLASDWLSQIPGLVDRLQRARRHARRRSAAARAGRRSRLARAFPELRVDGFDNDEASIAAARKHAAEAGVSDRANFEVIDVTGDLAEQRSPPAPTTSSWPSR